MPPAVRRPATTLLCVLASALATAGGAAAEAGFTPPDARSPNADGINDAYNWIAIFTGAIFLIVQVSLLLFIIRYRRRRRSSRC